MAGAASSFPPGEKDTGAAAAAAESRGSRRAPERAEPGQSRGKASLAAAQDRPLGGAGSRRRCPRVRGGGRRWSVPPPSPPSSSSSPSPPSRQHELKSLERHRGGERASGAEGRQGRDIAALSSRRRDSGQRGPSAPHSLARRAAAARAPRPRAAHGPHHGARQ